MSNIYYSFPGHSMDVLSKASHLRARAAELAKVSETVPDAFIKDMAALYVSFAGCMDLLAKQLPFKAGDRVRLVRAPKCEGGWAGSKHFLIVGAIGTVKVVEVDYLMRDWSVYVEFDDESWISTGDYKDCKRGDVVPVDPGNRHIYGFKPESVELLSQSSGRGG